MKVSNIVLDMKSMLSPLGFTDASEILKSGIYILCKSGVPIYIGQSKRMLQRIAAHRGKGDRPSWSPVRYFQFDQIFIRPVHVDRLDEVEKEMIALYKPRFNVNHNNSAKVKLPMDFLSGLARGAVPPRAPKLERRV